MGPPTEPDFNPVLADVDRGGGLNELAKQVVRLGVAAGSPGRLASRRHTPFYTEWIGSTGSTCLAVSIWSDGWVGYVGHHRSRP